MEHLMNREPNKVSRGWLMQNRDKWCFEKVVNSKEPAFVGFFRAFSSFSGDDKIFELVFLSRPEMEHFIASVCGV